MISKNIQNRGQDYHLTPIRVTESSIARVCKTAGQQIAGDIFANGPSKLFITTTDPTKST